MMTTSYALEVICECPCEKGSRSSRIKSDSAVMNAEPLILRMDHVVDHRNSSFKNTADDTLLPPDLAFTQFSIREKTCELGARASATRRAVVSFAGTQHKVFTVDSGELRWPEQFDVIDLVSVASRDSRSRQRLSNATRKIHQLSRDFRAPSS